MHGRVDASSSGVGWLQSGVPQLLRLELFLYANVLAARACGFLAGAPAWAFGLAGPADGACPQGRQIDHVSKHPAVSSLSMVSAGSAPTPCAILEGLDYMPNPFRIRLT